MEAEEQRYWICAWEDGSGAFGLPSESKQGSANLRRCLSNQHNPAARSLLTAVVFFLPSSLLSKERSPNIAGCSAL